MKSLFGQMQYKTENEFILYQTPNKSDNIEEIKKSLKKLDNVSLYDFMDSVEYKNQFDNRPTLEIAFFDKFGSH